VIFFTLLFPKRLFGKKEATTWLESHGYRTDIDNKPGGVRAVVGKLL
jgi:hypothetical protein